MTIAVLLALLLAPPQETADYAPLEMRGFTLQVQTDLDARRDGLRAEVLEVLDRKLGDLVAAVPESGVAKLREVTIWVSEGAGPAPCANYHPSAAWLRENGYDERKALGVEINNASVFLDWIHEQPAMVLHELAHAFHHQVLGYDHAEVAAAHRQAVASGRLDAVRRFGGAIERHYALTNPMEWFAETTEALFGTNDYFPFVRGELLATDPAGAKLVAELWGAPTPSPPVPNMDATQPARDEVITLHRFFHEWFAGELPNTDEAFARFADAMAPEFRIVAPSGEEQQRDALLAGLRAAHGNVPKAVEVDRVEARAVADGVWLVTYREWQRGEGEAWRGRASSALLREDRAAPGGFRWVFVQETWLPEGVERG